VRHSAARQAGMSRRVVAREAAVKEAAVMGLFRLSRAGLMRFGMFEIDPEGFESRGRGPIGGCEAMH